MNKLQSSPLTGIGGRIFLLGFMGTGKSHWGRLWASAYDLGFYDLDTLIEKEERASVADIFEKIGEDYFRIKEATILREQQKNRNCIVACGGGTPCFYDNMQWMNKNGSTLYLSASPNFILKNILAEKEKRPLTKNINENELLFFVEQKLKERLPFYSQANIILDAETLAADTLETIILPAD